MGTMNLQLLYNSGIHLEYRRVVQIIQTDPTLGARRKRQDNLRSAVRTAANAVLVRLVKSGKAPTLDAASVTTWLSSGLPISMGADALMALERGAHRIRETVITVLDKNEWLRKHSALRERLIAAVRELSKSKAWQTF
jgi:hypothetical protein